MGRPRGSKNEKNDNLQNFAIRIEREILKSTGEKQAGFERLICRLVTNPKNPAIAAVMASKWVEWRYGKSKETHEHKHEVKVEMTLGDADALITGYFAVAGSAENSTGASDTGQAQEQDSKLLSV